METDHGYRNLKKQIGRLLLTADTEESFEPILKIPERRVVGALLSCFFDRNELVRWRAVSAFGMVVDQLAKKNLESARVIMRRLMWSLNDESGGIGWGSPEAMGEVMARNRRLAEEYHKILLSYAAEDQNYLEHEMLQRGLLWGIGRLGREYPEYVLPNAGSLHPFMGSHDPIIRGLAVWAALPLETTFDFPLLSGLSEDPARFPVYEDFRVREYRICDLAVIRPENMN